MLGADRGFESGGGGVGSFLPTTCYFARYANSGFRDTDLRVLQIASNPHYHGVLLVVSSTSL